MGRLCFLCNKRKTKDNNITLHGFAKNPNLRDLWLNACGLTVTDDVSHLWICSEHFRPQDYKPGEIRKYLKENAVPSLLGATFASNETVSYLDTSYRLETDLNVLPQETNTMVIIKTEIKTEPESNVSYMADTELLSTPTTPKFLSMPRYISEIELSHLASPRLASGLLKWVKKVDKEKSKKIKHLQTKNGRLIKRLKSLEEMIKPLRKGFIFTESDGQLML